MSSSGAINGLALILLHAIKKEYTNFDFFWLWIAQP